MGGKGIRQTEACCNMCRVRGGTEYIEWNIGTVPGESHDLGFPVREEITDLFNFRAESIDSVMVISSDRSSGPHVSAGRASEADIEPVAEYRLHRAELLSDNER